MTDTSHPKHEKIRENSPLDTVLAVSRGTTQYFGQLYGAARGLMVCNVAKQYPGLTVVVTEDMSTAYRLDSEIRFFLGNNSNIHVLSFPDWETLPYDIFSPHQDIISQRLETLYRLPSTQHGILIVPVSMLMQRIAPSSFLQGHTLLLETGEKLDLEQMRLRLQHAGYQYVSQVAEHGEFTVRGSLLDLFPMGNELPIRIDLFDDEIESIRTFNPDSQRTLSQIDSIKLLPAREFPTDEEAIARFRQNYRENFEGDPQKSLIYRDVSQGFLPSGIEYYLPLFFDKTATIFEYLPNNTLFLQTEGSLNAALTYWTDICERYEQRRHDTERPILAPGKLFLADQELSDAVNQFPQVVFRPFEWDPDLLQGSHVLNYGSQRPPSLQIQARAEEPAQRIIDFLEQFKGRVLFAAETEGRREVLLDLLKERGIRPKAVKDWPEFLQSKESVCIAIAPLEEGMLIEQAGLCVIAETQLYGERVQQRRRRRGQVKDSDAIFNSLAELTIGTPVVHQDHGVGRYLGLQMLDIGDNSAEFLTLEYAKGDKLYVPVSSLHLISRYTGGAPESAPLHRLGSDQWDKAKRKAAEKVRDVAAELLEIYARREASRGHVFKFNPHDYYSFAEAFPFEETPDQLSAIDAILHDMENPKPMDRLVCGDVGFGKTEVAMRAAFVAVNDNKQVVVLVPTTLLAQQHYQNFRDRFADWPVKIEVISRFKTKKEQDDIIAQLERGTVDIVIGTHKLLQDNIKFKHLGLLIVDEEHRFGVRQKEKIKAICHNVDMLSLTATPIPRTLNMAMSGIRDLSIIATPPTQRMAVKTFVGQWDNNTVREACLREIKRGGQVYFLYNEVDNMERFARELRELIPEAKIDTAHGQMREKELEQIMSDFYHRRFNILVASTIIESGIDIPTANTILIHRADKFGLAQLHQLRGRVGRSHHRAYAYLLIPPYNALSSDAKKRLEAIESLEDLGAGFMLASHDLEIRGAGELLGDEQSGQMHEVGFSMYMELLERAVKALKAGKQPELDRPLDHGAEVELNAAALIPEDYLPDVHTRLIMYKRIASAENTDELRELQVEMIDRFGLLPQQLKNLFEVTRIKLLSNPIGIRKIELNTNGGRVIFNAEPNIDPMEIIKLIQHRPNIYKLDGQDKLRVIFGMPTFEDRVKFVENLVERLSSKKK